MYRGAETSSSFYQSMRSAFAPGGTGDASVAIPGRTSLADIQHRLRAIGRPTYSSNTAPQPISTYSHSPSSSLLDSAAAVLQQPTALVPQQAPASTPPPAQVGADDDETLFPDELGALRMVEIGTPVKVFLGELQQPPRPMQLLAEEANVKIFPRHVYISRPNSGAPIAEIVIMELTELTEDEPKGTLSFFIRKANTPTTTIVEIHCPNRAARSAMYKIVCSKRSALEPSVDRASS